MADWTAFLGGTMENVGVSQRHQPPPAFDPHLAFGRIEHRHSGWVP
ncbi:MAG: hypothetical protein INR71_16280 [Terriglobus roseus]|nr:hypothetical protein [Terriglobus roseus]